MPKVVMASLALAVCTTSALHSPIAARVAMPQLASRPVMSAATDEEAAKKAWLSRITETVGRVVPTGGKAAPEPVVSGDPEVLALVEERDSALARVAKLEADLELTKPAGSLGIGGKSVKAKLPSILDKLLGFAESSPSGLKFLLALQARSALMIFTVVSAVFVTYLDLCLRVAAGAGALLAGAKAAIGKLSAPKLSAPNVNLNFMLSPEEAAKKAWLKKLEKSRNIKARRSGFLAAAGERVRLLTAK